MSRVPKSSPRRQKKAADEVAGEAADARSEGADEAAKCAPAPDEGRAEKKKKGEGAFVR